MKVDLEDYVMCFAILVALLIFGLVMYTRPMLLVYLAGFALIPIPFVIIIGYFRNRSKK